MRLPLAALVLLLALPGAAAALATKEAPANQLTVMTRNIYLGADLTPLFAARSLQDVLNTTGIVWAQQQANNFNDRAQALAKELAASKPDVVGLQEASLYRSDTPFDFSITPAETVVADYLQILVSAAKRAGVDYAVAGIYEGTDAELALGPMPTMDIRFTDRIAVLVRKQSKLKIRDVVSGQYGASLGVPVSGVTLPVRRGFISIGMRLGKTKFRLVDTHLEAFNPQIRALQGQQLLAGTTETKVPMIILGDFNSGPGGDRTVYDAFMGAGFQDAWLQAHPGDATSVTCCHKDDLRDPDPTLRSRIDLVVLKGNVRALSAAIVGDEPRDRTAAGLWPSDHAGTVATLRLG